LAGDFLHCAAGRARRDGAHGQRQGLGDVVVDVEQRHVRVPVVHCGAAEPDGRVELGVEQDGQVGAVVRHAKSARIRHQTEGERVRGSLHTDSEVRREREAGRLLGCGGRA
jgi:hypothetical protein